MRYNSKEKIFNALFKGDQVELDPLTQEIRKRYETIFTKWLDDPSLSEREMIKYIINSFSQSDTQARRDLEVVKQMLGNVSVAAKEWQRYTANEMIKAGYALVAKEEATATDAKRGMAMIKAGEALCKVNKLDKDDPEEIPYEDIVPLDIEPTGDVSVLGIRPVDNLKELQERMRKKLGATAEDAKIISNE